MIEPKIITKWGEKCPIEIEDRESKLIPFKFKILAQKINKSMVTLNIKEAKQIKLIKG